MTDIVVMQQAEIVVSVADEINHEHELFTTSMRTGLEHAIRCGQLLIEQKEQLSHGEWLPWVMENCDFTIWHAARYMRLATAKFVTRDKFEETKSIRGALALLAEEKKASKPAPEPPKEVAFSWMKEENVTAALDGIKAVERGVSILLRADRDPIMAYHLLRMMRGAMGKMIEEIDQKVGVK